MDFQALMQRLREMPWAKQWRLLAGLALLVAGALGLAIWGFAPEYAPLFPTLPEKEAGAVMAALDQNGYAYKLGPNGGLLIERSKVYEARYKLAAQGLPKTTLDESMGPPKFGASSSQEAAYEQKIKELELARTINGISGVSGARVHLALPHQTIFGKETTSPTASVAIDSSRGVSRPEAAAIAHLVANATPGMKPSDVSIIDAQGKLLTRDDQDAGDTPEQKAYANEMRMDLQARIEHLLDPLVGRAGSKAEIDVALEFGNEEAVTESWKPNSGDASIRSQQLSDTRQGGGLASGIPGSTSNSIPLALPPLPGQQQTPAIVPNSSGATQNVTNYELDRSVIKSVRKNVKIKKIRAAVLVDYKHAIDKAGKSQATPLLAADVEKIKRLIEGSIGLDEDRGDSLEVINMPFVETAAAQDEATPVWKDPYWIEMGLMGLKWAAILFGILWMARQARRLMADLGAPPPPTPEEAAADAAAVSGGAIAVNAPLDLAAVKLVAQGNPQAVASVIKGWVEGEGNE